MARNTKQEYTERVSVAITPEMLEQIDELAAADSRRPRGSWIRIQLERVLEELKNGKAKK